MNSTKELRSGQSLIELLVAVTLGALIIGSAVMSIILSLRSKVEVQAVNSATVFMTGLIDGAKSSAEGDWPGLYALPKGATTQYYFVRDTNPKIVQGVEGVLGEDLVSGLVGYWKFDEAGVTVPTNIAYDSSANNNKGTLISGPTRTGVAGCKLGGCLDFLGTGDRRVDVASNSSLNFGTGTFSVSMWGFYRDFTYPKTWFMIKKSSSCYTAGHPGWDIGQGYTSNGIEICYSDGTNLVANNAVNFDVGYRPTDTQNRWTHFVAVFDKTASRVKFYVNGVKQTNEYNISSVTGTIDNSSSLIIGNMYGWQTDGLLDDVRVYNRGLSAAEVSQLYKSKLYNRSFSVQNVCRNDSGRGSFAGITDSNGSTTTCVSSGGIDDPSTQQVIAKVTPVYVGPVLSVTQYLVRSKNSTNLFSDWSGIQDSDITHVYTSPTNNYSDSNNIDTSVSGQISVP